VVSLGTANSYAVLGGSTVTNTGASTLFGDLGLSPGTSVTGFPPGVVNGETHINDSSASEAQNDALQAYNTLSSLMVTSDLTGQNLNQSVSAGVYNFSSDAALSGTLTLDGSGDFVFLIGTTLTTASGSIVSLINGAKMENVFFRVGTSATLGTTSEFAGTIIADASITATNGADVHGRLLALNGAVTLDGNNVSVPEPSSLLLFASAFGLLLRRQRINEI
jgi:hypothetical protein